MTATSARSTPPLAPPAPVASSKRAELCDLADCIAKIANTIPHPAIVDSKENATKLHAYVKRIKQIAQTV